MAQDTAPAGLNRRRLFGIGAAGAGAIATGATLSPGTAQAQTSGTQEVPGEPSESKGFTESLPAAVPGRLYVTLSPFDFDGLGGAAINLSGSGTFMTSGGTMVADVQLPHGAILKDMHVGAANSSASGMSMTLARGALDSSVWDQTIMSVSIPVGSTNATLSSTTIGTAHTVDRSALVYYLYGFSTGSTQRVLTVRIGYEFPVAPTPPAPPQFVPISPIRVLDSRLGTYGALAGTFAPNTSRVVPVKDGRDGGGVVNVPDAVPVGAKAVAYNLTVTGSTGPNFLSIGPGDAASLSANLS